MAVRRCYPSRRVVVVVQIPNPPRSEIIFCGLQVGVGEDTWVPSPMVLRYIIP